MRSCMMLCLISLCSFFVACEECDPDTPEFPEGPRVQICGWGSSSGSTSSVGPSVTTSSGVDAYVDQGDGADGDVEDDEECVAYGCEEGYRCIPDGATRRCLLEQSVAEGGACAGGLHCRRGLHCQRTVDQVEPGVCVAAGSAGLDEICWRDNASAMCEPELYCWSNETDFVCQPRLETDAACWFDDECPRDHRCDRLLEVCLPADRSRRRCTSDDDCSGVCEASAREGAQGDCAIVEIGEACFSARDCVEEAYCISNVCTLRKKEGKGCAGEGSCALGLVCRSGREDGWSRCLPPGEQSDFCDDIYDCAPGFGCMLDVFCYDGWPCVGACVALDPI